MRWPWNSPHSSSTVAREVRTRCLEPVTVAAPPRNASSIIAWITCGHGRHSIQGLRCRRRVTLGSAIRSACHAPPRSEYSGVAHRRAGIRTARAPRHVRRRSRAAHGGLERLRELRSVAEARLGPLLERSHDDSVERSRDVAVGSPQRRGHRDIVRVANHDRDRRTATERRAAGQELVEDHASAVDTGEPEARGAGAVRARRADREILRRSAARGGRIGARTAGRDRPGADRRFRSHPAEEEARRLLTRSPAQRSESTGDLATQSTQSVGTVRGAARDRRRRWGRRRWVARGSAASAPGGAGSPATAGMTSVQPRERRRARQPDADRRW